MLPVKLIVCPTDFSEPAGRCVQAASELAAFFHAELLLGGLPGTAWRDRLLEALGPKPAADAPTAWRAVALVLASPEAQLA